MTKFEEMKFQAERLLANLTDPKVVLDLQIAASGQNGWKAAVKRIRKATTKIAAEGKLFRRVSVDAQHEVGTVKRSK